jgi:hypothetical protein
VRRRSLESVRPFTALAILALVGCGARTAELPPQQGTTGGENGCEDRVRARPICLRAVETRCASMRSDCEARCEPRLGPGNSEKEPALRGDMEADRCREGCRQQDLGCRHALADRCPRPCLAPLACEPADPACEADAGP